MSQLRRYISIGFDEDTGEADFEIGGIVCNLSQTSMDELRCMIVVAIGSMEDIWRSEHQKKHSASKRSLRS